MLLRLFGENFLSFRDRFDLSFVAADLPGERGRGTSPIFPTGSDAPLDVLRCVALFGANASGKTNLLRAASALGWLIRDSSRTLEPDRPISFYKPFALEESFANNPSKLGATVLHENVLYEYELWFTATRIEYERLIRLDAPDTPLVLRNAPDSVEGELRSASRQVQALLAKPRTNVPILSFLAQHGPESGPGSAVALSRSFATRLRFRDYSTAQNSDFHDPVARRIHQEPSFHEWVLSKLLVPADLGIQKLETEEIDFPPGLSGAPEEFRKHFVDRGPYYRTLLVHKGNPNFRFDLDKESSGTRKMYNLSSDWWSLAHRSVTTFADELSASLHPLLVDHLVRSINHRSWEPDPMSQLAFVTHDTGLLESRAHEPAALRRDQVYFTKKQESGASILYSLAEFKNEARGVHNLRRRYLDDRYGAIPHIERILM
ncbi:MAG: ATP-binding protein [Phycisphaerales bacterium]|nr:ATP-binding protein [Phycisphaerales bacterium]